MTKAPTVPSSGERTCLKQRIFHAGSLLLHCRQRLLNFRRSHSSCAEVANFLYLQQVKKSVALGGRHQTGLLPDRELPRGQAKNPDQVFPAISIHVQNAATTLSEA